MRFTATFLSVLFCLCFSTSLFAQKKVKYNPGKYVKKASITLTAAQAKVFRKYPMLKVVGNKAYPKDGVIIYGCQHAYFVSSAKDMKKGYDRAPGSFTAHFEDIGSGTTPDGTRLIWVCSCGSNQIGSDGDDCYMSPRPSGVSQCAGFCAGGNAGKSCSVTMDVIRPDGTATTQSIYY